MFGKERAEEIRRKMSEANRGRNNPMYGKVAYPKPYFSEKLGHVVRSSWEEKVCLLLRTLGLDYDYEPRAFEIVVDGKVCTYTPDLKVTDDLYIEVKGPLYTFQAKKMRAFVEQHRKKLILVGADRYKMDLEILRVPFTERERLAEVLREIGVLAVMPPC